VAEKSLFGTSGIRGPADTLFTKQFCFDIGRTFVEFLRRHGNLGPIAIGMDPRQSSPRIRNEVLVGLATSGKELYDEGVTPIPSMNWLIKNTQIVAGVMVTGSHIAPELNGVKFYAHEEEVSVEDQREIESIYLSIKENQIPDSAPVQVHLESRAAQLYSDKLFSLAKMPFPKWKVGLDCANGAQSVVMPSLLERLGLEVLKVNCDPQDKFIARDTDADDKAQLETLKEKVPLEKCDFGIAFDGDGDRVVFIDERGNFIQGEYSCGLVAKQIPGEYLVTPISASQVVDTLGKKVIRTKVGSPYVVGKMKEVGASFGFESNGGAISPEIMYTRDGGSMSVKMLNLLSKFNGKFSDLVSTLPKFYMFRTKVDYKWELKDKILDEAKKHFKGVRVEELDGLKIWIDDTTWMLFRSSANAPEFRVFAESKVEGDAKKLLEEGISFVNDLITTHGKS
jgi:phosphomannomutase/phosphoglucomutase